MHKQDKYFMSIALELAKLGNPSPNPYVGAVLVGPGGFARQYLVNKHYCCGIGSRRSSVTCSESRVSGLEKQIIGKGFHKRAGLPHAEVEAINSVRDKSRIKGSTLYVTLEPCSHYGKTPPCTDAILKYGIKKVICSVEDPTKKVNGIEILRKKGVKVEVGLLEKESRELNEIFFHYSKTNLPFVAIKVATSKDKKIGFIGKRTKITGSEADAFTHKLRSKYEAILVGINTVLVDNPQLTSRIKKHTNKFASSRSVNTLPDGRNPKRIILDPELKIPLSAKVLHHTNKFASSRSVSTLPEDANVTIVTLNRADKTKRKQLERKGISFITFKRKINLHSLLKTLGKQNITSILVEGGAKTHKEFIKSKLVNKFYLFISPRILGNKNTLPLFDGLKPKLKINEKIKLGRDNLIIAKPC